MAIISSSLSSSLLPLLCLLLAVLAATNQQQEQPTPASPPMTLPGCPDKCGNVSIPYPFGIKEGCFRPGFFVICNDTFDPPRPFINSSLALRTDNDFYERTQIIVEDLYYLISEDGTPEETKPNRSAWPIELVSVSLSEGKARLLGAFSYDCWLNETHRSVRRQDFNFDYDVPFVLSAEDNVLTGIGFGQVAELTKGPTCSTYMYYNPLVPGAPADTSVRGRSVPIHGPCSGRGCCQATLLDYRGSNEVTIRKKTMYDGFNLFDGYPVVCFYAMIVEKAWYNFSTGDLHGDAFLRKNAEGLVPVVAEFNIGLGGRCPEAGEPTPKDFACISDNSKCVQRVVAGRNSGVYCNCSVGYQGNPYIPVGCQGTIYASVMT